MQSVSDDELDNAKHEVEFCIRRLSEMEPAAKALSDTAPPNVTTENLSENLFHIIATKSVWVTTCSLMEYLKHCLVRYQNQQSSNLEYY